MPETYVCSVLGPRDEQEDAYHTTQYSLILADGMGGHEGGATAAQAAVEAITEELEKVMTEETMEAAFSWAAKEIRTQGGGGTTLIVAHLLEEHEAYLAWVGDSRAYRARGGEVTLLTDDHKGRDGGLTRWLPDEPTPDIYTIELLEGDRLLLCTDGISDVLDDDDIADALMEEDDPAGWLVEKALEEGTTDNCTALVWVFNTE